ncbi:hypothetical protein SPRG_04949 [Saprolegnia parasitica CBS 223.65]|uniref:Uncharacterized protein n=1 Tax=Saprolegnia parasitica (strain CBS 223.65) TaxID=695850 RepID=A0A067CSV8_SAPPC|nr:hypothetical protein SPRG_04949 [Saprolegnia parasitica CBS 223.65]KDO29882.1 hypothetical protein SPRG_04949 [Saprolegnia parasitica CBS 223.65]|eukprot:XP_012199477.1 hypothetical protein SPRG_04949 [Saprolegnia parasitica CBS 223.65]
MSKSRKSLRIVVDEPDVAPTPKATADEWWRYSLPPPGHLGKHTIDEPRQCPLLATSTSTNPNSSSSTSRSTSSYSEHADQFTTPQSKSHALLLPRGTTPLLAAKRALFQSATTATISPPTTKRSAETADLDARPRAKYAKASHPS